MFSDIVSEDSFERENLLRLEEGKREKSPFGSNITASALYHLGNKRLTITAHMATIAVLTMMNRKC